MPVSLRLLDTVAAEIFRGATPEEAEKYADVCEVERARQAGAQAAGVCLAQTQSGLLCTRRVDPLTGRHVEDGSNNMHRHAEHGAILAQWGLP